MPDSHARTKALDISQSICVTAPAGSGKTELLSQRVLKLLASAEQPEQILAITFTRKAAAEMRERIIDSLRYASEHVDPPKQAHKQLTWSLARDALQQSAIMDWELIDNPKRLRIQTIDSLCQNIASDLPILSRLGGTLSPADNPDQLYHQAVGSLMSELEGEDLVNGALTDLLLHLDNNLSRLYDLFITMLRCRDQWLDFAISYRQHDTKDKDLEDSLHRWLEEQLCELRQQLLPFESDLCLLARFAAQHKSADQDCHIKCLNDLTALPDASLAAAPQWLGLFSLLLTKANRLRKTVTKAQGFPSKSVAIGSEQKALFEENKLLMSSLLEDMSLSSGLEQALSISQSLVAAGVEAKHHTILQPLTQCLIRLYAHLRLVFSMNGECDYIEITLAALEALLGSYRDYQGEAPTAVAHKWDREIRHILIDEFQDTSVSQFNLIQALTAEWHQENVLHTSAPRTLFIVGDGMQSIYSFRAAKVGLFIRAKEHGIGDLPLVSVELVNNFRSTSTIVDWNNSTYRQIFPTEVNYSRGAVPYSPSQSMADNLDNDSQAEIVFFAKEGGRLSEATKIVDEIQCQQSQHPSESIAILVRSRTHLVDIIPALNKAGIAWSGIDLDPLKDREVIHDCLSMTKAMLNPADTVAWLAILRGPWCGLTLADLQMLADCDAALEAPGSESEDADGAIIATTSNVKPSLDKLVNYCLTGEADSALNTAIKRLSQQGGLRLTVVARKLQEAWLMRSRLPMRSWLEKLWTNLHGPTLASSSFDGDDSDSALAFFDLVERLDQAESLGGNKFTVTLLEDHLQRLFTQSVSDIQTEQGGYKPVQIMTIHKAKGLEFDSVIVPGLDKGARSDTKPLLYWNEHLFKDGSTGLLLCPIDSVAELNHEPELLDSIDFNSAFSPSPSVKSKTNSHLYTFLADENKRMLANEYARLLYVATTRAKSRLLLSATLQVDDEGLARAPSSNSLLHTLWPAIHQPSVIPLPAASTTENHSGPAYPLLKRLKSDYFTEQVIHSDDPDSFNTEVVNGVPEKQPIFSGQHIDQVMSQVGTCIHEVFEFIGSEPVNGQSRLVHRSDAWRSRLQQLGVCSDSIDEAVAIVVDAVKTISTSSIADWLFSSEHQAIKNEWPLSYQSLSNDVKHFIIDRSFIDADKTRWIIDYKTAQPSGSAIDEWLAMQVEQYTEQLHNYHRAVNNFDRQFNTDVVNTQCALYLPLVDQLLLVDSPLP